MKSSIFWDMTLCSLLKVSRCFGETYRFHIQFQRISQARNQREAGSRYQAESGSACYLLHAGFLLDLFFDPKDGGDMFLRNVG
jgi:hypothetical protein